MDDYMRNRTAGMLAWRAFARSAGIFTTVILTLFTKDPIDSLGKGIMVWMGLYFIRQLDDQFVDRNFWSCCSPVVLMLSLWPAKTILLILAGLFAVGQGIAFSDILLVFGGLLIYDLHFVFSYGS